MNVRIIYSNKSEKFLKTSKTLNQKDTDTLILNAVKKLSGVRSINIHLKALKGKLLGKFRIRKGNLSIIFWIEKSEIIIVNVDFIGTRSDAY
jgi:mRNA-degrading endonuclease RelE of RelBE toxin-antitoxin system